MKRYSIFFHLLFFCTKLLHADPDALHAGRVREGLEAIYSLDYLKAQTIFERLKTDHPESPVGYGMLAVTAWHALHFASRNLAIYEYGMPTPFDTKVPPTKPVERERQLFLDTNRKLLEVCDQLLAKKPQDALALYFKGLYYENLSTETLTLGARREVAATSYARRARKMHKQALEYDPSLIDTQTSIAVPEYVVGAFPWGLRVLALLLGIRGNKEGALAKLQVVMEKGVFRATDALVVMALLEAWKGDPQRAISNFSRMRKLYPRNFLADISLAVVQENSAKDFRAAIQVYQELLRDLPSKAPGIYPGEIRFRIARNQVKLRDYSLALGEFQRALEAAQGDLETRPLTYHQMGQIYEERGEKSQAQSCYRKVLEYSGPKGVLDKEIAQARKKLQ